VGQVWASFHSRPNSAHRKVPVTSNVRRHIQHSQSVRAPCRPITVPTSQVRSLQSPKESPPMAAKIIGSRHTRRAASRNHGPSLLKWRRGSEPESKDRRRRVGNVSMVMSLRAPIRKHSRAACGNAVDLRWKCVQQQPLGLSLWKCGVVRLCGRPVKPSRMRGRSHRTRDDA
jgi:hypothetical protein